MPHIIEARYNQGLAAYRAGHAMRDIINVAEEIEASAEKALDELRTRATGGSDEETAKRDEIYKARQDGTPSLIAGFADGFIEDIRLIAAARRGQRA